MGHIKRATHFRIKLGVFLPTLVWGSNHSGAEALGNSVTVFEF